MARMKDNAAKARRKVLLAVTKSNWGGAQKYVYDIATSLPPDRFDVAVAFGEGGMLEEKLRQAGIRTIKIGGLGRDIDMGKDLQVAPELAKIIRAERPDVLHLNSSKMGGIGALVGRVCGVKKIIFTVHGFAFNEKRSLLATHAIVFASWLTLCLSTDIIFISRYEKAQASRWPFIGKQHLIYNGIAAPDFATREESRKMIDGLAGKNLDSKIVIGSIGELTANKGYTYALEAIKEIITTTTFPIHYIIFSDGEDRDKLAKLIQDMNLSEYVTLAGFVDKGARYLTGFDIFLLSSQKEGLPYVILEAGYAKLPVIATRVGGIPEAIEDTFSGLLIPPQDSLAITENLNSLLTDKVAGKKYGEELYKKVSSQFSKQRMIDETIEVYEA